MEVGYHHITECLQFGVTYISAGMSATETVPPDVLNQVWQELEYW